MAKTKTTLERDVEIYLDLKTQIKNLEAQADALSESIESEMNKEGLEKQESKLGYVQMTTRVLQKKNEGYGKAYQKFIQLAERKNLITYYSKPVLVSKLAKEK